MARQIDAVLLGLDPCAECSTIHDGAHADTIAKAARALTNALQPPEDLRHVVQALARHVVDAATRTRTRAQHTFAERVDSALQRRAKQLRAAQRCALKRQSIHQHQHQHHHQRAAPGKLAASARASAEGAHLREVEQALTCVRQTANDARRLLLLRAPTADADAAAVGAQPLPLPPERLDVKKLACDAANRQRIAKLNAACAEDRALDPSALPRFVKNRLAAHKSNAYRAARTRLTRQALQDELCALRALALHAAQRARTLIDERPTTMQEIATTPTPTPTTPTPTPVLLRGAAAAAQALSPLPCASANASEKLPPVAHTLPTPPTLPIEHKAAFDNEHKAAFDKLQPLHVVHHNNAVLDVPLMAVVGDDDEARTQMLQHPQPSIKLNHLDRHAPIRPNEMLATFKSRAAPTA